MTNQQKFIEIFGIDAWQQMIVFSGLAEQFKEYWTSPYKAESEELRWCNTCEFKHLESECLGCAEYDDNDNLIDLRNYKKEE